jgi:hypothetical protein
MVAAALVRTALFIAGRLVRMVLNGYAGLHGLPAKAGSGMLRGVRDGKRLTASRNADIFNK